MTTTKTNTNTNTNTNALSALPTENVPIPAAEITQYTGIAKQTHNRWRHEGIGPRFAKLGRRVIYFSDDIRAWMQSCYQPTTQQDQELNRLDTKLDIRQFKV